MAADHLVDTSARGHVGAVRWGHHGEQGRGDGQGFGRCQRSGEGLPRGSLHAGPCALFLRILSYDVGREPDDDVWKKSLCCLVAVC